MAKFEVGKTYWAMDDCFEVTVTKRTDKTVWFDREGEVQWFMRIKHDKDGNEYAVDSKTVKAWGKKYLDDATYQAKYGR